VDIGWRKGSIKGCLKGWQKLELGDAVDVVAH
jgi:hypothetical protein